jgi:hypothetical protein
MRLATIWELWVACSMVIVGVNLAWSGSAESVVVASAFATVGLNVVLSGMQKARSISKKPTPRAIDDRN